MRCHGVCYNSGGCVGAESVSVPRMCVCARGVGCYSNLLVVETGLLLVFVAMAFATAPVAVLGGGGCLGAESVSAPRVCGCAGGVGCCSSLETGLQFMYVSVMNVLLWCWCSSKRRWLCSAFVAVSAPRVCAGCGTGECVRIHHTIKKLLLPSLAVTFSTSFSSCRMTSVEGCWVR